MGMSDRLISESVNVKKTIFDEMSATNNKPVMKIPIDNDIPDDIDDLKAELIITREKLEITLVEKENEKQAHNNMSNTLDETMIAFDNSQKEFDEKLSQQLMEFMDQENKIRDEYDLQIQNLGQQLMQYQN